MELRQLQCLVACAQTRSFSKAGAILFTSQSNVSKTIASLEKELGKKLFERKQHGIELTEKGKQIYQLAVSMIECSEKIMDCAEEEDTEELRVSFQSSSWFAAAFCDYYLQFGGDGKRYHMISAPVDEIIRRISGDLDQLGFAYIEESKLSKLHDVFQTNHLGYYTLKKTGVVLYKGKLAGGNSQELPLVQGTDDYYSGIASWREKENQENEGRKPKVVISTNSDYIMQEILNRTDLSNISPEYLSHEENKAYCGTTEKEDGTETVQFLCLFRNDRVMESLPKHFLSFVKKYVREQK